MFLRHSEGVYSFGSKKVHVKVEKGGNCAVRVGGGYMTVDNFIKEYTPGEVRKLDKRDVI